MNLYNTLTQRIEPFTPSGETVSLYVCGITPYDTTHLGHAFTYTAADILVRYLESQGLRVNYVQNVTDIDDDILRKAREVGDDWRSLGNRWTSHFIRDMQALNVRPPNHYPRASDVIPEIVEMVAALIERGLGYELSGNVYYHVDRWPGFGRLSHLRPEEMLPLANERGNRPDDPHKADPLDFVLWQAQAPGEPAWDSPWGPGRPGWHIECSALSTHFIGPTLDLHSGGSDLIFPHHECEIAQSEAATGQHPFVRVWLHTAMVEHEGEKMSKSLGNLVMVSDLLRSWSADALRVYMGSHHYRKIWAHNAAELGQAAEIAARFRDAVTAASGNGPAVEAGAYEKRFTSALENDLDTPTAMATLDELAALIVAGAAAGRQLDVAQGSLRKMSQVFGLRLDDAGPEERVTAGWDEHLKHYSD